MGCVQVHEALQQTQTGGRKDRVTDSLQNEQMDRQTDRQRDTIKFIVSLLRNVPPYVKTVVDRTCTVKVITPHLLALPICIPSALSLGISFHTFFNVDISISACSAMLELYIEMQ